MTGETYLPAGMPKPAPMRDGLDKPYWEAAAQGILKVQRCNACGAWQWGPEWLCHACRSFDIGWQEVEPKGRLYSWARSWHPVHPALKERGAYIFALIELPHAGNIRMVGNLLGDAMQPITIDAPVEAVFEQHDGYALVQWRFI